MEWIFFILKWWIIGFSIAAPIGPTGMLCIRKSLEYGMRGAIVVGIGAALADAFYGGIAIFGVSALSQMLIAQVNIIKLFGGAFLIFLAWRDLYRKCPLKIASVNTSSLLPAAVTVFCITFTNPLTILTFISVFTSINISANNAFEATTAIAGIYLGSFTWWLILGGIISATRKKFSASALQKIRYFSIGLIGAFGIWAFTTAIWKLAGS
jgi:putative LysE/RhtB family amino acid efflux pump